MYVLQFRVFVLRGEYKIEMFDIQRRFSVILFRSVFLHLFSWMWLYFNCVLTVFCLENFVHMGLSL